MKIGDEVFVHGYIDEIRKDTVIIRNNGGYFGTIPSEVITGELPSAQPEPIKLHFDHALTEEEIKNLKQKITDSPIVLMPSAQPKRKTGKWIDEGFYADGHGVHAFRCSECGGHIIEYDADPFCRWCGADMRGEQDEKSFIE